MTNPQPPSLPGIISGFSRANGFMKLRSCSRWMVVIVVVAIIGVFVGLDSIVIRSSAGANSGPVPGKELPGTHDMLLRGEQNFSLSPDDRWILYPTERGGRPFSPVYVLYDIANETPHEVGFTGRARELSETGRGPLRRAGCWDPDGSHVFLPGDRILFVTNVRSKPPQWNVVEDVDTNTFRYYYECPAPLGENANIVRVFRGSPGEVIIFDAKHADRVIARHKKSSFLRTRIDIQYLTVSPDRKHVAYLVTEYTGSFSGPSRGFVVNTLDNEPTPQFLATFVFGPIRWSADGKFAYAAAGKNRDERGIYRWEISE